MAETEERKRGFYRGGATGPVLLISLGVVFLLMNLGVLEPNIWWKLLRMWPVLLIAAGIDLFIARRSLLGYVLAFVLIAALFAGAIWLAWTGPGVAAGPAQEISQSAGDITQARIVLAPAASGLYVEALPEGAMNLVQGVIYMGRGERVNPEFEVEGGRATFTLRSEGISVGPFPGEERAWRLELSPDVPLNMEVSLGAGEADLDLTGLTVDNLKVNTAAGLTTVTLPDEGSFDARVEGAVGQVVVIVPEGMAVRIQFETALVTRQTPQGYRCQEDVCTSANYAGADHKVNLDIGLAIGAVEIREAGGR